MTGRLHNIAPYRVVRLPDVGRKGRRWKVVDRADVQQGTLQYSEEDAQLECQALIERHHLRQGRRERPCLTCGTKFESTGFGHRMCDPCRLRVREAAW